MSKFLTYEERLTIARLVNDGATFTEIAKAVGKSSSTIAKEIKKYAYEKKTGRPGYPYNTCHKRMVCKLKQVCGEKSCAHPSAYKCSICPLCNNNCSQFTEEICLALLKPPYVCNACSSLGKCTLKKKIYDPADAQSLALKNISEARSGILSNERELDRINRLITPLLKQGQSVHHVYQNHVDEIMCCEKTIYNYIDACLLDVRNIDLPRRVRFRQRYKNPEFKVDRGCRLERNYQDFLKFMDEHPDIKPVQMDSVIGSRGGKVLLTIHFVEISFMLAFLRDVNTSKSVIDLFNILYNYLGKDDFCRLFPVILTDNGSEFSNPKEIEYTKDHIRRTRIFYCDPGRPYQKGSIEVNHELIRRVIPKGTSMNDLAQDDIFKMMSHINSYKRKKLNDRSPYEAFSFYYGEELAHKLGCFPVIAGNILLKPSLLTK